MLGFLVLAVVVFLVVMTSVILVSAFIMTFGVMITVFTEMEITGMAPFLPFTGIKTDEKSDNSEEGERAFHGACS